MVHILTIIPCSIMDGPNALHTKYGIKKTTQEEEVDTRAHT